MSNGLSIPRTQISPPLTCLPKESTTCRPANSLPGFAQNYFHRAHTYQKLESELLPLSRFSRTLKGMEAHFSPDVETQLQQVASANGKNAEQLVKDTVARMLENQALFIAGVQRGIEQADRGEFVEHKDVLDRIDRLFHS